MCMYVYMNCCAKERLQSLLSMRWLCFRLETPPDVYSQFYFGPALTSVYKRVLFSSRSEQNIYVIYKGNNNCFVFGQDKSMLYWDILGTAAKFSITLSCNYSAIQ